jgi:dTDP-4-amino-4,6-dideoxygalactose transaminase
MGGNYRMTELQSALGRVALERFPEQAEQRAETADYLDEALSEIPGIRVLRRDPRHTTRSFYCYIFAIEPDVFGFGHELFCKALHGEGIPSGVGYEPMNRYELFQPQLSRLPVPSAFPERFNFSEMTLPAAEQAGEDEAVWLGESIFRAGREGVADVVTAVRKIYEARETLANLAG